MRTIATILFSLLLCFNTYSQEILSLLAPEFPVTGQEFIQEFWEEFKTNPQHAPTFEKLTTTHEGHSFEELWEIARQSNPSIRQKANLVTAAMGGRVQAGLYPNPTIGYTGDSLGVNDTPGKHGMSVTQPLVTAKKKKLDRKVASYDVDIARRNYSMECSRVYNDLRIAHYELVHAELAVRIEHFCQYLSIELLKSAYRLEKEGKSKQIDILKFKTSVNESRVQLQQAANSQEAARKKVAAVIGLEALPANNVQGTLQVDPGDRRWEVVWAQYCQTSPQLAVAQSQVSQAHWNLARQEAERVPDLNATVSISNDATIKQIVPLAGVSMPLKIYDRNQGNIAKARAQLAAANREVQRIMQALQQELAGVLRDYENADELVKAYETTILPDTFRTLSLIDQAYQKGEFTYLDAFAQRQAVMLSLLRYIEALKTRAVSATLLDGMLLRGSLNL